MKNKVIEKLDILFIILLFILMITSCFRITYTNFNLKDYGFYLSIYGIIFLIIYIISKIKNFKFSKLEIILIIMIILSCLSLINAIDLDTTLYGKMNRREGLFVWLTYYLIALNCINIKNKKYLKIIIYFICLYSFINIFYGLFQVGLLKTNLFIVKNSWYCARGLLGNSMFFGTLMNIFYGIILGLFLKCKLSYKKIVLYILLFIASLGIVLSGAMSAIFALGSIYLICLIQIIISIFKKEKNSILCLIFLIVSIISFGLVYKCYSLYDSHLTKDLVEFKGETNSLSQGKIDDSFGTGRFYIWRKTIEKIKDAPITGYGIDNFRLVFNSKLLDSHNLIVDKAHNDYLQKSLCEGIISGVVFVIFLLIIFFKLFFKKLSPIYYGLFLAFTSYSIQAFFNISVTRVAPIYFIIIGLLIGKIYEK